MTEKEATATPWTEALLRDDRSEKRPFQANLANVVRALKHCPDLQGAIAHDEFHDCEVSTSALPWRSAPGRWQETDNLKLAEFLQNHGLNVSVSTANDGVRATAFDRSIHPVRDYLTALVWDGTPRLDQVLATYFGAEDEPYVRVVGRKFMISMVARVFQPGCQVDTMLILEGEQGIGKSTGLRELIGNPDWYTGTLPSLDSRDAYVQLQGKWLLEVAELDAFNRHESNKIKAFITTPVDRYRPLYGKTSQDYPRQCVFVGTTNDDQYLRDPSGGRRFWPVSCKSVDRDALAANRDQLWAEAVAAFQAGEQWHLDPTDEALAQVEQKARFNEDPWANLIDEYVWPNARVTIEDILITALEVQRKDHDQQKRRRVTDHLKTAGWHRKTSNGKRYWDRPSSIPSDKQIYVPSDFEQIVGMAANDQTGVAA